MSASEQAFCAKCGELWPCAQSGERRGHAVAKRPAADSVDHGCNTEEHEADDQHARVRSADGRSAGSGRAGANPDRVTEQALWPDARWAILLGTLADSMDADRYPDAELVRSAARHIEELTTRAERAERGWTEVEALLHVNEAAFDEDTKQAVAKIEALEASERILARERNDWMGHAKYLEAQLRALGDA